MKKEVFYVLQFESKMIYSVVFLLLFCSSLNAYHASVVLDDDPLLLPNLFHLITLEQDAFLVHMMLDENQSSSYRVYPFLSTLNKSGFYRLVSGVTGTITITANDIMLDLSGNTVSGGIVINSNLKNITIKRGTILATGTNGVLINPGCSTISLYDLTVQNAMRGVALSQVTDSVIERCTMTSNVTGLFVDTSSNILVTSCNAVRNTNTGFSLNFSTTCSLVDCKALSTGDGNTAASNNNIYGFVSQNGFCNEMSNCIANATQALSTTDYNSIVAGFALTGTEQFSRISDCIASNAATSAGGVTIPYGMYLQSTLSDVATVTTIVSTTNGNGNGIRRLSWTSDGQYLAVGAQFTGSLNGVGIIIYQFNRLTQGLEQLTTVVVGTGSDNGIIPVSWSPDGRYLLVAGNYASTTALNVQVYSFSRISQRLTPVVGLNFGTFINGAAWSPDGQYIALSANSATGNGLRVYFFDSVANTLSLVNAVLSDIPSGFCSWSPDGNYIALVSNNGLYAFRFDQKTGVLTQTDQKLAGLTLSTVRWFPNQKYVVITGNITVQIYSFNNRNGVFTLVASGVAGSTRGLEVSPDGRYVAVGLFASLPGFRLYSFNQETNMLTLVTSPTVNFAGAAPVCRALAWSPDGGYIAQGYAVNGSGGTTALSIVKGLSFPSNNVLKNNSATCNSGGGGGVGISGSSIANLIIQNTAYDNPRNPSVIQTNYQFVCNVFNQLFGVGPTYLQNKEVNNLIAQPTDIDTTVKIVESKLSIIQDQVTRLLVFV